MPPRHSPAPLPTGLILVHGNRPEQLRQLLLTWVRNHPLAPLETEVVLVQSNGMAQWLRLALAADISAGGCGIAAGLELLLPSRFLWQVYRSVLGPAAVPENSPFDKPRLLWRLMRLLPQCLPDPVYAPLARFLSDDADLRKRFQLATRLADLFDQYQVYRADWLASWAAGDDCLPSPRGDALPLTDAQRWQAALWRALLADVACEVASEVANNADAAEAEAANRPATAGRAAVHDAFMAAARAWGTDQRPPGLPRRVLIFGISSLPRQSLEVLAMLSQWTQVLMCVHNPCQHYWADIVADKELLRTAGARQARRPPTGNTLAASPVKLSPETLHQHAHPLLAAWGKQGRDFIGLLDEHDDPARLNRHQDWLARLGQRIDLFETPLASNASNSAGSLLQQLQDDIFDLRPLNETRSHWPPVDPRQDRSLRFHLCHSPQREVEVLHDQLLAALAAEPTLQPRDIIVMVPEIDTYAPHIQAVFGRYPRGDNRHLPFALADLGQRQHDPLLGALEKLLNLPLSRLGVSEVLDLLEVPALQARFGINTSDLPLLQRWIHGANIRWGLHAAHRDALVVSEQSLPQANTWAFGLRRLLLGYAVGANRPAWNGIEAHADIGGLDAALLGPLASFIDRLEATWISLSTPASVATWCERLNRLLDDFFLAGPDANHDAYTLQQLRQSLQRWQEITDAAGLTSMAGDHPQRMELAGHACSTLTSMAGDPPTEDETSRHAGSTPGQALPLGIVAAHWLADIEPDHLGQPFLAGAVIFATLMPMRAIPFSRVCLLGMNDGDYPRQRPAMDFDLMAGHYRPGDRSRREDDRYLFLEALLSARDHLHISWVGRSVNDNTLRPPSVLVGQLRDHLAAGWRLAADSEQNPTEVGLSAPADLLAALSVEHRLQAFSPAYFNCDDPARSPDGLFTHAHEWRQSRSRALPAAPRSNEHGQWSPTEDGTPLPCLFHVNALPLPEIRRDEPLNLAELARFLKDPVKAFFQQRLHTTLAVDELASEDHEPFALDGLEHWQLQSELIDAQLAALASAISHAGDGAPARQAALDQQLQRIERRGELATGAFARLMRQHLAEPMATLFERYQAALARWPQAAAAQTPDAPREMLHYHSAASGLTLTDSLPGIGCASDPESGAPVRARVVLDHSELIKANKYRGDKMVTHWLAHLAAHLAGGPLTTEVVGKTGSITLQPLEPAQAQAHLDALLAAWKLGQTRPLPLAIKTAFAWLARPPADCEADNSPRGKAQIAYAGDGWNHDGELGSSLYLQRCYPSLDALVADGQFATLAQALYGPLAAAMPVDKTRGKKPAAPASPSTGEDA